METYRAQLERAFERRGLRPNTQRTYESVVRQFCEFHDGVHPATMGAAEIEAYFEHLRITKNLAPKSLGVHRGGLSFYYGVALGRAEAMPHLIGARTPRTVPEVLNRAEIEALLRAIKSPKIRTVCMVMYGSGLRVSEACALQFGDIDSQRGVMHIREGEGGHSRYALLSNGLVRALRAYYRKTRPPGPLLFPGQHGTSRPITREAINWGLALALAQTQLSKRVSPHSLRHSFATSMLESGVDLRTVQVLLGHRSIRSTAGDLHIALGRYHRAPSPLDRLELGDDDSQS